MNNAEHEVNAVIPAGEEFWQLSRDERHLLANKEGITLLFDKPKEYTSARVVNIVKKFLNVKKAGHSGTLDPKATGLMIVCTGKKTKQLHLLLGCDKEYEGIMVLGKRTKSFDTETEVYETNDISLITFDMIQHAVKELTGEISQVPPMFSAVKHKGKPLYKLARKGHELERKPKQVNVKIFEVMPVTASELSFRVLCTKGTYIRSLISDLGDKLGIGAYLKELRRTAIGEFKISDAMLPDDFIKRTEI
ncbi:MAG: tRNA pseudouridine synthase B [Chlorobi bacterium OLB5]|nr:MAG: tRNA pseudouridine synthase B [Chlorobi bacterium OLB5]